MESGKVAASGDESYGPERAFSLAPALGGPQRGREEVA